MKSRSHLRVPGRHMDRSIANPTYDDTVGTSSVGVSGSLKADIDFSSDSLSSPRVSHDSCIDVGPPIQDNAFSSCESNRVFNGANLMHDCWQSFITSRTALAQFCRASLVKKASNVQPSSRTALWPVPPPRWCWTASKNLSPKRRARKRRLLAKHRALQLIVSVLNWECLGHPKWPPAEACVGAEISDAQHLILEHLDSLIDHHLDMADFKHDDLGRFADKHRDIIKVIEELPHCQYAGEDLLSPLIELHREFDAYGGHFGRANTQDFCDSKDLHHQCSFDVDAPKPMSGAREVVADRIKWENPPSFDATPFLENPLLRSGFLDPEVLRLPEELWPPARPAKIHCKKRELLALAERWDQLGACRIMPASEKRWEEAVGLFTVGKDSKQDRLIINPQCINSRMFSISECTKMLPPGAMISLMHLQADEVCRVCADDLSDCYYTFCVSYARACRNALRMKFKPSEISHLKCFDPSKHFDSGPLLICLSSLAMGDSLAVEVAQQSHTNVLKRLAGSMVSSQTLRYRFPFPTGKFIELLAIDDHVTLQKLPRKHVESCPPLRDTEVFRLAGKAYREVHLVQHEKKQKRNLLVATVLGADFDGLKGRVSAPRSRIILLSRVSLAVCRVKTCTRQLLQILLGCWIHVLLFRRPLFAILDALFHEGQGLPANKVFCLSPKAVNELQAIALLGPVAQADLRVSYSPFLYCTDASPTGGAVCRAQIGVEASKELWRHTEQKGFYTKLQNPVSSILAEHGLEPESNEQFQDWDSPIVDTIPRPLKEGFIFDCIEIFRGTGNWSKSHIDAGLRVHDGIDVDGRRMRISDLSDASTFRELSALACRGVIRDWHCGVPCPSFGTLRRPAVRSKEQPFGFDPTDSYTAYHNRLAQRSAMILILALRFGSYISVEQPGSSRLFLLHLYKVLVTLGCVITHFRFCSFGSAFEKHSKWLHNKPWLVNLGGKCSCKNKGHHFVIQGCFTKANIREFEEQCSPSSQVVYGRSPCPGEPVSSFSAAYPLRLTQVMAAGSSRSRFESPGELPRSAILETVKEVGLVFSDLHVSVPPEPSYPPRPWYEDPEWMNELSEGLAFKEVFRFQFVKSRHINVNETRTYKSWIKSVAKTERDSRVIGLLDSRVTLGAAAKGRSSSYAISRILQGSLGYIIGGNLYPGGLHVYSASNRADDPSRGKPVRPASRELPSWFVKLQSGDPTAFDAVTSSSSIPKNPARWLRFLLLLAGDIEPHPGPKAYQPRGPMSLDVGFAPETAGRMKRCLAAFRFWLEGELKIPWETVIAEPEAAAWGLRSYGLDLFERGLPRYLLVYAITGMQDTYPQVRQHLHIAWQVDRKWQAHEPGHCRAVLPAIAIRASITLAFLWGWQSWAGAVLIGFAAMLHPGEIVGLTRKDLVFPRDVGYDMDCLFVHVRNPKTSRFARRQHGRIDDVGLIKIFECLFGNLPLSDKLFVGSISLFRKQWNAIMSALGIPCKQNVRGATPGVLRGSGATYWYACTENIPWIAWRGRWARTRTLEFYLQEVSAQLLLHELPAVSRAKIELLSNCSLAVVCHHLNLAEQHFMSGKG